MAATFQKLPYISGPAMNLFVQLEVRDPGL
jgi:hypothetical protein